MKTTNTKKLLIVAHTPSSNTNAMATALLDGAEDDSINGVSAQLRTPFTCVSEDVLASDALILFTTENFGYMSGALKDFFERIYYPCLEDEKRNQAKPYCLVIRAGLDGTGTESAVNKITQGLNWKEVQPTMLCKGQFRKSFIGQCRELGQTMAASLESSII